MTNLWAAKWHSKNRRDGETNYLILFDCQSPTLFFMVFKTRQACRAFIKKRYGFIADRPDLQAEPFGWRVPQAVKVEIREKAR